jgi:chromosome partitioning protein
MRMAARVVTVAQQKGGAGKTTVTVHLALALAALGEKTAVIDIDPQGSLSHWFGLRQQALGKDAGIAVSSVHGWRVGGEVDRLSREYKFILIDSPPHAQTESKSAIRAAQLVVIPVQASPLDLWATKPTVDIAKDAKVPVLLLLNRLAIKSPLREEAERILGDMGVPVARTRIGNRVGFATSMNEGRGIGELAPKSAGAREMRNFALEVVEAFTG